MTRHRDSSVTDRIAHEPTGIDIYDSPTEQEKHEQAVEALAEEFHRHILEVQEVYERAYIELKSQATVKDFLPVFVARHARAVLRQRAID